MKRIYKLLIALLCVCLCAGLFACGDEGNSDGDGNGDGNNTSIFKSSTEIADGFKYGKTTIKVTENGVISYMTFIESEAGSFYADYNTPKEVLDGTLVLVSGTAYVWYSVSNGQREFLWEIDNDDAAEQYMSGIARLYFGVYTDYDETAFVNKGASTVAGRACTKYSFSYSFLGSGVEWEYNIDNATGCCLKYVGSSSSNSEVGSFVFEATEFVPGTVSLAPYSTLPLKEGEGGVYTGNSTSWPTEKILLIADFFTAATIPVLDGFTTLEYTITEFAASINAEGITEAEHSAYKQKLVTNGYSIDNEYEGDCSAYKEFNYEGQDYYVEISLSFEDGALYLSIFASELY